MTEAGFVGSLVPGLQYAGARGFDAALLLAMAAHESGWVPLADSTYTLQDNPWGVVCYAGAAYPCDQGFLRYPSLLAAATDLVAVLPASAIGVRSQPEAFMLALQEAGWDASAPTTYAEDVLQGFLPEAERDLEAAGLDPATAQPEQGPAPHSGGPGPLTALWLWGAGAAAALGGGAIYAAATAAQRPEPRRGLWRYL